MREIAAEVAILGGGVGGCAAALAAARNGLTVVMTEETDWIGGQLTAQAVPPDEHPWIEQFGGTRTYRAFRQRVRDYYKRNYPLTGQAHANPLLNPGNGSVSRLCCEPRVALAVLYEMLNPYLSAGQITLLLRHKATSAEVQNDQIQWVVAQSLESGERVVLSAPFVLDATELGDLLPMTGAEFVTGAESQRETGEAHAPAEAQPHNQQAFTVCFAMDYLEGEDHTISKPEEYDFWQAYTPQMNPPWTGRLLSLTMTNPFTLEPRPMVFDPIRESEDAAWGFWRYRRILDKRNFTPGSLRSDVCLVNWPMNDYWLGNLIGDSETEAEEHLRRAKSLSLSLLYWLQTEAPRPDGGTGWKGLRLRGDVVGTEDGLAKYPYVRESRRIRAEFTVLQQHLHTESRMAATGKSREEVAAEPFADSVGVGQYRIDLHPSSGGDNYIDVSCLPFQIPLGALIPIRLENLIPACKNLGVTHITNGCYRLHPVEWNIGEAAGALVAYCHAKKTRPRAVRHTPGALEEFQKALRAQGIETAWARPAPL